MIMPIALISDPEAKTTAPIKPRTMSEKYSAGPNLKANCESGAANAAKIKVATQPAKKEAVPAVNNATPPRPFLAIWYPSIAVTTEDVSPGMFSKMAVVEPPYCEP